MASVAGSKGGILPSQKDVLVKLKKQVEKKEKKLIPKNQIKE